LRTLSERQIRIESAKDGKNYVQGETYQISDTNQWLANKKFKDLLDENILRPSKLSGGGDAEENSEKCYPKWNQSDVLISWPANAENWENVDNADYFCDDNIEKKGQITNSKTVQQYTANWIIDYMKHDKPETTPNIFKHLRKDYGDFDARQFIKTDTWSDDKQNNMGVNELKNIGPFLSMAYIILQDANLTNRKIKFNYLAANEYGEWNYWEIENLCVCEKQKVFVPIKMRIPSQTD
jgi:hypothetical protein